MEATAIIASQRRLDAIESFQAAESLDDLWANLCKRLVPFGITGSTFGTTAWPGSPRTINYILNSIDKKWANAKLTENVIADDAFVNHCMIDTRPALWHPETIVRPETPGYLNALAIDHDYGVITGVTIPLRAPDGLTAGTIDCHARAMSWGEFDKVWEEHSETILTLAYSFNSLAHTTCVGDFYSLTRQESEILKWLANGHYTKQVSDYTGITDSQLDRKLRSIRKKLKANNTVQAVATAVAYRLVSV